MTYVRTRIAPSPTGRMHIGTVRTALFNYLFAKHHGGTYFVRIEDTDKERNKLEWVDAIWEDFAWCGLTPDEKYIQSEHLPRHRDLLHQLVNSGRAYVSKEPAKDDPSRVVEVVRLKNPGTRVTFADAIRGDVSFDTTELGDFVIARSIDDPLYHFAVVADDGDAQVTHVLRAEEHISNTPRQILIQEALELPRPIYGHFPLILAPDKSKLSKRKHAASIEIYRDQGFMPEALINYLALLGWNPGTPQEMFSMEELIAQFSLEAVQKSGAVFDPQKLRWFNREYMKRLGVSTFVERATVELSKNNIVDPSAVERIIPVLRERAEVWSDVSTLFSTTGELSFLATTTPTLLLEKITWKGEGRAVAANHLTHILELLKGTDTESWSTTESIKALIWPYADSSGRGSVLWPLRYALTGQEKSPDPFTVAHILGREESIKRIESALAILGE